jgi:hypothetical protein
MNNAKGAALLLFCSLPAVVFAQHGKLEKAGLYNFPYKGDTWTGEIVAAEPSTREITLQYVDKKGQAEKFIAKLLPTCEVLVQDHPERQVLRLNRRDKIIAYYIAIGQKYPIRDEQGKKKDVAASENLIFRAEVILPNDKK